MTPVSIKEMVKDNKVVRFKHYKNAELWYVTECGFEFPVPLMDTGDATFLAEDKAILFMRYIRKHIAMLHQARIDQCTIHNSPSYALMECDCGWMPS